MHRIFTSLTLALLFCFLLPTVGFAQPDDPSGDCDLLSCDGAQPPCDGNLIFSGTLCSFGVPGDPFPGCGGFVINNPVWYSFIATQENVTVNITPSACGGGGIQAGLYEGCDFNAEVIGVQCACTLGGVPFNGTGLEVGTIYYVFVDGCAGDVCDYVIEINQPPVPPITPPFIFGPQEACPGAEFEYCTPLQAGVQFYDWEVTGGILTGISDDGNCITVLWPDTNGGTISVTVDGRCDDPETFTLNVISEVPEPGFDEDRVCQNLLPYIWTATFPNGGVYVAQFFGLPPGIYVESHTEVGGSFLGCDTTINFQLEILPVGAEFIDTTICQGDFFAVGGIPFDEPTPPSGIPVFLQTQGTGCDSIVTLVLRVLGADLEVGDADTINCNQQEVDLFVINPSTDTLVTYTWTTMDGNIITNPDSPTITVDQPGTYTITVEESSFGGFTTCLTSEDVVVVANTDPPILSTIVDSLACFGDMNGSITVVPSSGVPPFSYLWEGGETTDQITGLGPGMFMVTVTGSNGCTETISANIPEPVELFLDITDSENALCNGVPNGSATASGSGGTGMLSYLWSDPAGQTSPIAINLAAGTYTVTMTDAEGCSITESVTITEPDPINLSTAEQDADCNGAATGRATVLPSGGTTPYGYEWSDPMNQTTATANDLLAGTYTVTVTDDNGCIATTTVTIEEPPAIDLVTSTTDAACNGDASGTATVIASGGSGGFTYIWDDPAGQTDPTAINIPAGTYNVTVTDSEGCSETAIAIVTEASAVDVTPSQVDILCNGDATGSATVVPAGGTLPYTFLWNDLNGTTDPTATGLTAGNYSVTITDGSGCNTIQGFTITEPDAIVLSMDETAAICNGEATGTATVSVTGGTPGYTYLWNDPSGQTDAQATGLLAGTYTVTVTDLNNCTEEIDVVIEEPTPVTAAADATPANCFNGTDGEATATPGGGIPPYTYMWSDGMGQMTSTAFNLPAGTYTVTITDANNCTAVASTTVDQPTEVELTTSSNPADCNAAATGDATVNATGGTSPYSYSWSDAGNQTTSTATGLAAGTYTVTVTDANSCVAIIDVTVSEPTPIELTTSNTPALCNGGASGTASVSGTGGTPPYSYLWNDPADQTTQTATGLAQGSYIVTVTDQNGCTNEAVVDVAEPTPIELTVESTPTNCNGDSNGTATVTPTGGTPGYTYLWNDPSNQTGITATNLLAGSYIVTVTDLNGCTEEISIIVDEPTEVTASADGTDASCFQGVDGTVTATPGGGIPPYTYVWSDPSGQTTQTANNLPAGTYTVTISDSSNCTEEATATIGEPTALEVILTSEPAECNASATGSTTVVASGGTPGYTYVWSDPSGQTNATASDVPAGMYMVTVTDAQGCTIVGEVEVTEPAPIEFVVDTEDADCFQATTGSATVTPNGGTSPYTYQWDDLNSQTTQTANDIPAGTYNVTITDANGCTQVAQAIIDEPTVIELTTDETDALCAGSSDGTATVTATGGTPPYTYQWNDPADQTTQQATGLAAGTYITTVTDAQGCTQEISVTVGEPTPIETATDGTPVPCFGEPTGSASVTASEGAGGFTYLWSDIDGQTTATATDLPAGIYIVTVTDQNGCTTTDQYEVIEPTDIELTTDLTEVSCNAGADGTATVTATGGTPPYTYLWNDPAGQTNDQATDLAQGSYTVTVTDANDCTDEITVVVPEPTALEVVPSQVNILCFSDLTGEASVQITGGTGPYTYLWNDGAAQTDPTATGLGAGDYEVEVTDAEGCTLIQAFTITEPAELLIEAEVQESAACFESADGSAMASASGGVAPYTYQWNDDDTQTTAEAVGLTAGDYTVTITDANGCSKETSIIITEPTAIQLSTGGSDVLCRGGNSGSVFVQADGGTAPYTYSWDDGLSQMTDTAFNLIVGTYTVTVTDANDCTEVASFTIDEPAEALSATGTSQQATCGDDNGSIDLTPTGGTPPYTYLWDNDDEMQDPQMLAPGTFTVTVTDANGCTFSTQVVVDTPVALAVDAIVPASVSCNGGSDGAIEVTISGGTLPYMYDWNDDVYDGLEDLVDVPQGDYEITITDANGCTIVANTTVDQPEPVELTAMGSQTDCGFSTGVISVTTTGGVGGYTYDWGVDSLTMTEDLADLGPGSYTLIATDANGCTAEVTAEVTLPNAPQVSIAGENISCFDGADGTIDLTIVGGTAPFTYIWDNPNASGEDPTNLPAGTYNVTVRDANQCVDFATLTLTHPDALTISSTFVQATCGEANGSIDLTVGGGTQPYTYDWDASINGEDPSMLFPGVYTVTVTDDQGCTITETVSVIEPDGLNQSLTTTNTSCNLGTDGAIDITPFGGTPPYAFIWDDMTTTEDRTDLSAGLYLVTISDAEGCSLIASATIEEPTALELPMLMDSTFCFNSLDGTATVNATGGTGDYTYEWSDLNGQTTQQATGLGAGTYTVTVTDENGCTAENSIEVLEPTEVVLDVSATLVSCFEGNDAEIELSVVGGTAPYTFDWDALDDDEDPTGVAAGTYSVTVTDAKGCSSIETIAVDQPTALEISGTTTPALCGEDNGGIDISVTGGTPPYEYDWGVPLGQVEDPKDLKPGLYVVTVTDAKLCELIAEFLVTTPDDLQLQATTEPASCNGGDDGMVMIAVSGGTPPFTFDWEGTQYDGLDTLVGVSAGTYDLVLRDSNDCEFVLSATVGEPTAIELNSASINSQCGEPNGGVTLSAQGGTPPYTYLWSDGQTTQNASMLTPGAYTVTVTDGNGCTEELTETVTTPNGLGVELTPTAVLCFGDANGAVAINATGGVLPYAYDWNVDIYDGQSSLSNVPAGVYALTLTDGEGCTFTAQATVDEPAQLQSTPIVPLNVLCNGGNDGAIILNVTGGTGNYTFEWNDPSLNNQSDPQNPENLSAGTYTVTITDENDCSIIRSASIVEPDPIALFSAKDDVTCGGGSDGSIDIEVNGGVPPYSYAWNLVPDITQDLDNIPAGTYVLIVTDANNCTETITVSITQPVPVGFEVTTISDYNGVNVSCIDAEDGFVRIVANGGTGPYQYLWEDGSTSSLQTNLAPGTYVVTITDAVGCTLEEGVQMTAPTRIDASNSTVDVTCFGQNDGQVTFEETTGGISPYVYSIENGPFTPENVFENLPAGEFIFTIQDANGCEWDTEATIEEPDEIRLDLTTSVPLDQNNRYVIDLGDSLTLIPILGITDDAIESFVWTKGDYWLDFLPGELVTDIEPGIRPFENTHYAIEVRDTAGCFTFDEIEILVRKDRNIFIPNIFTPNGDGNNDEFFIQGGQAVSNINYLRIFDRWGEQVFWRQNFLPNDPAFGWDGMFRGEMMNPQVFVYVAEIEFEDGGVILYKGDVTLVR